MSELKYCPFCGAQPKTRVKELSAEGYAGTIRFFVECERCGANINRYLTLKNNTTFEEIRKAMRETENDWEGRSYYDRT